MSLNNQNSQEKFFDENNYFKYSNRNKQNYVLKKRDINCKNDDKGIFFPNKENKFSIFMKNVNRNPLSSKILSTSLSQNILSFSTKNVNNNYSSTNPTDIAAPFCVLIAARYPKYSHWNASLAFFAGFEMSKP